MLSDVGSLSIQNSLRQISSELKGISQDLKYEIEFNRRQALSLPFINARTKFLNAKQSTKEMTGGSNYTSDTKTESSNRTLPIIPSVREELLKQRAFQDRNRNLLDSVYYLSDYVCTFADGKEITPNYLTKKFHQIISKHKELPQIRFHDLRHSVASNLLNDGFSTVQVAE